MKFGIRKPSLKKRIAARTSWKRYLRHNMGFKAPKGMGFVTNPKKAGYNMIYNKTSVSVDDLIKKSQKNNQVQNNSDIQLKISFKCDDKENTPDNKKSVFLEDTLVGKRSTQEYLLFSFELTGENLKNLDLNTFEAVTENEGIALEVDSVSILSDKKLRTKVKVYQSVAPKQTNSCISIGCFILFILFLISLF